MQWLTVAGLVTGVIVGVFLGIAVAVRRRAWRDYRTIKATVPGLQNGAWASTLREARNGFLAILLVVSAVVAVMGGGRERAANPEPAKVRPVESSEVTRQPK